MSARPRTGKMAATHGECAARRATKSGSTRPARGGDRRGRVRGRAAAGRPLLRAAALALGLLFAATGPGPAQDLTLRAGEHAGFTRLTLPLPDDTGWQLGRAGTGYRLALKNAAAQVDLSRAFARIGRERVAALRPLDRTPDQGRGLAIDLACRCHMRAFEDATGLLVLDIRDGPPAPDSPFEAPLAADTGAGQAAPLRRHAADARAADGYDWVTAGARAGAHDGAREPHAPATTGPALPDLSAPTALQAPAAESATRMMIKRNFSRAADQGLTGLMAPDWGAAQPGPLRAAPRDPALPPQIKVETAIDRARRSWTAPLDDVLPSHADCPAPDALDVSAWGDEASGLASVSRLRARLLGEFDRPEPAMLSALVRGYLHLGFGAEARAALAAFPGVLDDAAMFDALAVLIDGDAPVPGAPFRTMADCDGPSALWALLAREAAEVGRPFNRSAVISAFSALPLHLRRHLGPRLTEQLLAAGALEAAEAVRAAIGRAEGGHGADLEMIAAEIDLAEGRRAAALDRLARLARGSSAHAPTALALYAETRLDNGERIGESIAEAIAAGAVTHRDTALGERLARLEVLALAAAGRFGDAFEARDRLTRRSASPAYEVTEGLHAILTAQADDIEFLARTFAETAWADGRFAEQTRLALAERLLELGFPQRARQALAPPEEISGYERRLHARAALALDEPAQALRLIAGERGDGAARLRGAALARLGDHGAATAAYRAAEAREAMTRAAWLAGDGATIARHGSAVQRAAMGLSPDEHAAAGDFAAPAAPEDGAQTEPELPAPQPDDAPGAEPASEAAGTQEQGPLQRGQALLERSARMRATLDDLLDSHPAP